MRRILSGLLFLLLLPRPLAAHQHLVSAAPAADASLARPPGEIRLTFGQAVEPALARLRLLGPQGEVALGALEVPPGAPAVLAARIAGPLVAGAYTVEWLVTGVDGHPVRGEYSFIVEAGAAGLAAPVAVDPGPAAPGRPAPPAEHHAHAAGFDTGSPLYVAVRWLTFAGLLLVIGAVSFSLVLLPALRRADPRAAEGALGRARVRAASVGLAAAGVLAAALPLRLLAQSAALHGPADALAGGMLGAMLTRTLWGWGWALQAAATLAALAGLALARTGRGGGWGLAAAAVLALAVTPALSGHAAATSALAVVADGVHVLAAGAWLGTLLLVLTAGVPAFADGAGPRAAAVASLLTAFSPLALASAGLLGLTGLYAAWLHLPALPALWSSEYGRVLLLKLAALALVLGLGAYNWLRVGPALEARGDVRPLQRSAAAELAMGALVLAATAVLVATPPPTGDEPLGPRAEVERSPPAATP